MTTRPGDIVPADPRIRTAVILVLAAGAIAGILALGFVRTYLSGLEELARARPDEAARRGSAALRVLAGASAVPAVLAAMSLGSLAVRTWRSDRYPPPGARPVRSIRVRTGRPARRIALLAGAIAVILTAAGVILAAILLRIAQLLVTTAAI